MSEDKFYQSSFLNLNEFTNFEDTTEFKQIKKKAVKEIKIACDKLLEHKNLDLLASDIKNICKLGKAQSDLLKNFKLTENLIKDQNKLENIFLK